MLFANLITKLFISQNKKIKLERGFQINESLLQIAKRNAKIGKKTKSCALNNVKKTGKIKRLIISLTLLRSPLLPLKSTPPPSEDVVTLTTSPSVFSLFLFNCLCVESLLLLIKINAEA